ncbi:hypothetical protein FisN_28Lu056 [Fistulifera solaris]|jgi:lysophospholipase L1-like esterase|uniref:SGNH hydrolase-type esterase domain-containing protein n=1 Tax=Fistulifera solaris TaxID=1519565 RepID=A0A1Z5KSY5_FISSO|nr:hypothetical protein FisN_28Lu056 [Fistulifera solaris]|eukprot:GAX29205.1 hypothetical protein FisN_28Lu056 [Fistulifera solaris]
MKVALLGDSDVARWPDSEYPRKVIHVSGQSGATLSQIVVPHNFLEIDVVIVCAGENDIATNIPLWQSEQALRNLLQQLLVTQSSLQRVFFLGPKFEPWMQDDREMRKKYWQMNLSFQRIVSTEEPFATRVQYIDSLFLFCQNESRDQLETKGAVYKATPNPIYFHADQLHLSQEGYLVWKELFEQQIAQL